MHAFNFNIHLAVHPIELIELNHVLCYCDKQKLTIKQENKRIAFFTACQSGNTCQRAYFFS